MAFPVFTPPVNPSFPFSVDHTFRVNEAKFGDGYAQTSPDGLNAHEEVLSLTWENVTKAEFDTITAFIAARKGSEPFVLIVDGTAYTLKCHGMQTSKTTANGYAITASCKKVFDL